jgi:hypothetical protein
MDNSEQHHSRRSADFVSSSVDAETDSNGLSQHEIPSTKQAKSRPRTILSRDQVIEIFEHKTSLKPSERLTGPSIDLARKYHVSSKTIRDIWSGRSWHETTRNLGKQVPSPPDLVQLSMSIAHLVLKNSHLVAILIIPGRRQLIRRTQATQQGAPLSQ